MRHVRAHQGNTGNELADNLAKEGATMGIVEHELPIPISFVKTALKRDLLSHWQKEWDKGDKGLHTKEYFPKVDPSLRIRLSPPISAFLTGHGPFPTYLFPRNFTNSEDCDCGEKGTPHHYYFHCTLTAQWHLKLPNKEHQKAWVRSVVRSPLSRTKLYKIYYWLQELQSLT